MAPTLGYFISNRFVVGARFTANARFREGDDAKADVVDFFPQVRYYFNPAHEQRNWFGLLESNFDAIRLGGGVNYFLSPGIALEGFAGARWEGGSSTDLMLNLGLQFFLNRNTAESASITPLLSKGIWLLGGTAIVNSQKAESWQFLLLPNAGYFLSNRLAVGARLEAGYFFNNNVDLNLSSLGLSPFIRYYLNPTGGRTRWFLMADIGITKGSLKGEEQMYLNQDYTIFTTSGRGGLNYFLTPQVALEGTFGVHYSTFENTGVQSETFMGNTSRIGGDVGIQFFLTKRK